MNKVRTFPQNIACPSYLPAEPCCLGYTFPDRRRQGYFGHDDSYTTTPSQSPSCRTPPTTSTPH